MEGHQAEVARGVDPQGPLWVGSHQEEEAQDEALGRQGEDPLVLDQEEAGGGQEVRVNCVEEDLEEVKHDSEIKELVVYHSAADCPCAPDSQIAEASAY